MHKDDDKLQHGSHGHDEIDTSKGYEPTDVGVTGIVVFVAALSIFVVVAAVLSYGIGWVFFQRMAKEDGPRSKWANSVDVRGLGDLANNPEMQNKFAQSTQQFPTPRLQTDDGNQEIADLHAREDLLLEHYSWADQSHGKVRIPISRAMELIAQQGLPVAPAVETAPLMAGDAKPTVAAPLTNGFTRTGYEHDREIAEGVEGQRAESGK
jgi:hypothetical protein